MSRRRRWRRRVLDYRHPDSNDLGQFDQRAHLQPRSAVVMMTAYGTPEVREGALALGAYRVVDKPFDLAVLEPLLVEAHEARAH